MKLRNRHRGAQEVPSSAMSDIAFLLIVFFMTISIFAVKEGFKLKTPQKDKVIKKTVKDLVKVRLTEKEIWVDKVKVKMSDFKQVMKAKKEEKKVVSLEILAKVKYKIVVEVLDIFASLGIYDFSMKKVEG
jgi:biopolymer transport protein ExbD